MTEHVWVDGEFIGGRAVSELDRGFTSGLGLFETMAARGGVLPLWARHLARLRSAAARLGIPCEPLPELPAAARELALRAGPDAVVRLTLTAGVTAPTFCLTARARSVRAEPVRLVVASLRRPAGDPTADLKTTSRVFWELAAAEALRRGADDALVLGADGAVLETARANLFCAVGGRLCTARLDGRILPGVARAVLIENMASDGVTVEQRDLAPAELDAAEGLWVTNAVYGPLRAALVDRPAVRESDTFGRALATAWERALGGGESSRAGASDGAADRSIPTP